MVERDMQLLLRAKKGMEYRRRHVEQLSRAVRETTGSLSQARQSLSLIVGPRMSLASMLGKAAATNALTMLLAGVNPLLPLAVRSASTAHTLVSLSRVKKIGLGEALYSAKKSIIEVLEAMQC